MQTRITTLDLPSFARSTIGFDRLFNEIERSLPGTANTYPPYNIAKISDDEYVISLVSSAENLLLLIMWRLSLLHLS